MHISIIAAMGNHRVIGNANQLPWHLPADLQHFKRVTMGKPVLMGRKTFESIGRPLPGRTNVVVSRSNQYEAPEGIIKAHSICEAFAHVIAHDEVMIIGGASFYEQLMPYAETLYLTQVHGDFPGDAYFPEIDAETWREVEREEHGPDDKNPYRYAFLVFQRTKEPEVFPPCNIEPD